MSLLGVGVGARFEAVLPDGSRVSAVGSPGLELRRHVANELFASTPSAVVRAIDRICIAFIDESSGDVTEYCTTSLTWSVVSTEAHRHVSQVSGSVTAPASITVTHFRAKAGVTIYFESSVSPPFDVVGGQTVSLTMTLTLSTSHSPSVSGGLPSVASVDSRYLLGLLYDILRGARPSGKYLTLERAVWFDELGATLLSATLTRIYTTGATSGSASHDFASFTAPGRLIGVNVYCVGQPGCIVYSFGTGMNVTMADRARYSVGISVV